MFLQLSRAFCKALADVEDGDGSPAVDVYSAYSSYVCMTGASLSVVVLRFLPRFVRGAG